MDKKPFSKLDATKPADIKEMEKQLKEKYEASQKNKGSKKVTA